MNDTPLFISVAVMTFILFQLAEFFYYHFKKKKIGELNRKERLMFLTFSDLNKSQIHDQRKVG